VLSGEGSFAAATTFLFVSFQGLVLMNPANVDTSLRCGRLVEPAHDEHTAIAGLLMEGHYTY
jgi:hypothetical protein